MLKNPLFDFLFHFSMYNISPGLVSQDNGEQGNVGKFFTRRTTKGEKRVKVQKQRAMFLLSYTRFSLMKIDAESYVPFEMFFLNIIFNILCFICNY